MLNIYLLRHGETSWNASGNRYCGRTDIKLNEKGIKQAERVSNLLKNVQFEEVYSSPLQRALLTAQIAAGKEQVITDNRLIEADFGEWEAKTKEEFIKENPQRWLNWKADPMVTKAGGTGETAGDVITRVDGFFNEILDRHHFGNILVVAHNGVNRFYLAYKLGMDIKDYQRIVQENSSITSFTLDSDGMLTLKLLNSRGI